MALERSRQIRMSDVLWNLLGDIAHELGYVDKRGAHSALIREMVAAAAAKWHHSPYVCKSADLVAYVSRDGEIFYRTIQVLKLNADRRRLPCLVEMKPEKKSYFQKNCPSGVGQSEWFRSRWLLNYFSVRQGRGLGGRELSCEVDREGLDTKNADLLVGLVAGRFITREIVAGIRDYVQWDEGVPGYDRADFAIDIPTHELSAMVIVDEDLYRHTSVADDEVSDLALEFRNRESARFSSKSVISLPEIEVEEVAGRYPRDDAKMALGEIAKLRDRVVGLAASEVDCQPIASEEDATLIKSAIRIPRKFLFYSLRWRSPHLGIEACVRWEKPIKERGSKNR